MNHVRSETLVQLNGDRSYPVIFQPLAELAGLLDGHFGYAGRCLVITDTQVGPLYTQFVLDSVRSRDWEPLVIELPAGEHTKSAEHLNAIYDRALEWGIDRRTPVLALGGGVVGDLAGYAAATLLRGLPLVQIPTTCIAQVDSALGGKTGINHTCGKNLIGAFHQPRFVLADVSVLKTLSFRDWTSGLAEVVKHALIDDPSLFTDLDAVWDQLVDRNLSVVSNVIRRAAAVKARIVSEDERESGRRAILNFGHTFAHAIERTAGYGAFTHGEAVALGMQAALYVSSKCTPSFDHRGALSLVRRIPVPDGLSALSIPALNDAMKTDKKVRAGRFRFVLLRAIGEAYVTSDVSPADVNDAWTFAST